MSLEITGKLVSRLSEITGQGKKGEWRKMSFAVETEGKYSKTVAFDIWNDNIENIINFKKGENIKIFFEPESRFYEGKYYTNLKAWKIELVNH